MIQKIKEKLKQIFFEESENEEIKKSFIDRLKEFFTSPKEIISFFAPIVIAIILIMPVPYTITVGGGTINIDKRIKVENSKKEEGSLNSAYVKELKGRIVTYLLAKIIPSYELNPIEESTLENETEKEYMYREKTYFTSSLESATIVAYQYANKKIEIKDEKLYVLYILNEAETTLQVEDEILSIDAVGVNDISNITEILNSHEIGDILPVKVLRNNKEIDCTVKVKNIDNAKKIGIYLNTSYVYETNPKIDFKFTNRESGPSGGLMIALSIYNKLVDEDITKGRKIVGTGTIDVDGKVGEVGGIKEKLTGAIKEKADIFIVPQENYDEAVEIKTKMKYNIELLSASTFEEAIKKLRGD